jgi:VWFA-related protein
MRRKTLKTLLFLMFCARLANGQEPLSGLLGEQTGQLVPPWKSAGAVEGPSATEGYVRLDVAVTDKAGKPVTGLGASDLTLLDNGQATKLVSFHAFDESAARPDPASEVILVIDAVNLATEQVKTAEREVEKFLRANGGRLKQPTVLYFLSGWGLTRSGWPTWDGNALAAEAASGKEAQVVWKQPLRVIEPELSADFARGRNAFSLTGLGSIAVEERRRPGRKLLLWIGPGWPVRAGGESTFEEIVELSTRLREAQITLSSVTAWAYPETEFSNANFQRSAKNEKDASPFDMQLEALAQQSGGRVMEPAFDLARVIARCIEGANDFYVLTFDPPRTSTVDEYHELKVEVTRPDVVARTNTGYYDEPVIYDQPPVLKPVALAGLEEVLTDARGRHDEDVARELDGLELSERMSSTELERRKTQMPGTRSRTALVILADESAFLPPAAEAVPRDATPDFATQKGMIARTVDYVATTNRKLPDFFATRTTVRFEEPKQKDEEQWKTAVGDQVLHPSETTRVTIHNRNGLEVAEGQTKRAKAAHGRARDLVTEGTFGAILSTVLVGAAEKHSQLTWSRWEHGPQGREAVFHFVVPQETPLFEVGFCCLADPDGTVPFQKKSAFHGELAIDPETGAILRIEVVADLDARSPLERSGVVVEYGPVAIGGREYICPTRSISISRSRTVRVLHEWNENFGVYGPFESMVNDVTFSDYHVFRSTSRIVSGMETGH